MHTSSALRRQLRWPQQLHSALLRCLELAIPNQAPPVKHMVRVDAILQRHPSRRSTSIQCLLHNPPRCTVLHRRRDPVPNPPLSPMSSSRVNTIMCTGSPPDTYFFSEACRSQMPIICASIQQAISPASSFTNPSRSSEHMTLHSGRYIVLRPRRRSRESNLSHPYFTYTCPQMPIRSECKCRHRPAWHV
jgi:hypothetical protein